MKTYILLRAGAVLSLVYFAGHIRGRPWTPGPRAEAAAVVGPMQTHRFEVLGSSRSYWDFYQGFGLAIAAFLLVQTILLWQLAALAKTDPAQLRPIIALLAVGVAANAVLAGRYFFAPPLILALGVTVCLVLAYAFATRAA